MPRYVPDQLVDMGNVCASAAGVVKSMIEATADFNIRNEADIDAAIAAINKVLPAYMSAAATARVQMEREKYAE